MTRVLPALVVLVVLCTSTADAQPLGTFRWQLQPYCNVVSLAVTQNGGLYEIAGTDDQCGAGKAASAIGTAFLNPDGTIGFGLNIVGAPGGAPIHVEASIALATLNGTWHDSAGGTGAFVFTPGAGIGGTLRPASAAIGALAVNPAQIQLRVTGGCPAGQAVQRINEDGMVVCATAGGLTAVQTPAGSGLQGAVNGSHATLTVAKTSSGAFNLANSVGIVAETAGNGGKRVLLWDAPHSAFRAGFVDSTQWDPGFIGGNSVAMGYNTVARGDASFAMGAFAGAFAQDSAAIGANLDASGRNSIVLGNSAGTTQGGVGSFVFGDFAPSYAGTFLQSFAANQFLVRAAGGTRFYSNGALTAGVKLDAGASAWSSVSDVNMKENFRDLASEDVLTKIARMPIREWNYKTQDAAIRHVGPTAQDFHAAFGLGEDPLRISTIDADGIALAGVQALDARTREAAEAVARQHAALQEALAALRADIAALRQRLDAVDTKR